MTVLDSLEECARAWEPGARLLGNVTARDILWVVSEVREWREQHERLLIMYNRAIEDVHRWKRAAESQNKQWSDKCTQLTEMRARAESAEAEVERLRNKRCAHDLARDFLNGSEGENGSSR